jgi:amino acid transporter
MDAAMATTDFEATDRRLRRSMSFQHLFFLSMGAIIGSGWLFGVLAADSIAGPAVVFSWAIGGIMVLFIALTYAEVSGMLPRTGAIARYPHLTHGGFIGFLLSWAYFLSAVTVPAIEAEAVVTYASSYVSGLTTVQGGVTVLAWPGGILLAVALMLLFLLINYYGIRFLSRLNTVITWWKLIVPVITFLLLFAFSFHGSNFATYGGLTPMGLSPVFTAIATGGIVFAYLGFRQALDYAGEARDPQRDVPRATILSVVVAVILYTLLQIAFTGSIDWSQAGVTAGDWTGLTAATWAKAPFAQALQASGVALLGAFAILLYADAFISPSGTGYIYLGTATRTLYGMSIMGYLPARVQRLTERFRIPWIALAASTVIGMIFFAPLPSWYLLVGFISSATVLTYIMGGIGLQVLRRTAPELDRPFRLPYAAVLAPVGFLAATLIVYWSGFSTLINVVAAVFVALPLFVWFYSPARGWLGRTAGGVLGIVFLVVWILTQAWGGWVLAPSTKALTDHPAFLVYFALLVVEVAGFAAVLRWLGSSDARKAVDRSWWFMFLAGATLLLSYYGAYGPLKTPTIAFPLDTLVAIVIGLISFYWGVASGFATDEIREIVASGSGVVAAEPEEPAGPSLPGDRRAFPAGGPA